MKDIFIDSNLLPYVFAFLMALSTIIYAILDGYDLGVGMLTDNANWHEKDLMIASIGPFWDANETWLILSVGLLLVAFPEAHGIILGKLYMPVAIMLFGLIFRGVAFDFRAKVPHHKKWKWNSRFFFGSLITSLMQGYMLGSYITGFDHSPGGIMFSCLIAVSVSSAYCLIGACWLIMKCEGGLQKKAIYWAKYHLTNSVIGLISVSIVTPLINDYIWLEWFTNIIFLVPIPLSTSILIIYLYKVLDRMPLPNDLYNWLPFIITIAIYILSFIGLAYSFFPFIIPGKMTIAQAATSVESLRVMMIGVIIVLPALIGYTIFVYYIFHGKATELRYD